MVLCENLDSERYILARWARQNSDPVCGILGKIREGVRGENTQKTAVILMSEWTLCTNNFKAFFLKRSHLKLNNWKR